MSNKQPQKDTEEIKDVKEIKTLEKDKQTKGVFDTLNKIDVTKRIEKKKQGKTQLSYLSWAWAWAEVKKEYPEAQYRIHKYGDRQEPYLYDENLGYMVTTDVTIEGITHEMWLPVMNHSNKAMKSHEYTYDTKYQKGIIVETASMFDINKTIMRCMVKNLAMHGLALYIYAGEDLPENAEDIIEKENENKQAEPTNKPKDLVEMATKEQIKETIEIFDPERIEDMLKVYNKTKLQEMTKKDMEGIIIIRKRQLKTKEEKVEQGGTYTKQEDEGPYVPSLDDLI